MSRAEVPIHCVICEDFLTADMWWVELWYPDHRFEEIKNADGNRQTFSSRDEAHAVGAAACKSIFLCTKGRPWDGRKGLRVEHDGAREVGEQEDGYPGGDIITMECPNCKHTWKAELPQ